MIRFLLAAILNFWIVPEIRDIHAIDGSVGFVINCKFNTLGPDAYGITTPNDPVHKSSYRRQWLLCLKFDIIIIYIDIMYIIMDQFIVSIFCSY